jgi:hypothetical protein
MQTAADIKSAAADKAMRVDKVKKKTSRNTSYMNTTTTSTSSTTTSEGHQVSK